MIKALSGTEYETGKFRDVKREVVEQGIHWELKKGPYKRLYEAQFE